MNKIVLTIIAVLILITGGVVLATMSDSEDTAQNEQAIENVDTLHVVENNQEEENTEETVLVASAQGLGYVDYTDTVLEDSNGSTQVLFFHAPWCSVCNFFEGQIEEQGVPDGVTIVKIDFDSETELKNQYGVNVQSTFVLLDENGEIVNSWPFARGLTDIQDLYDQV
jgi:thioredoxin-like negative regulator of GroEL